MSFSQQQIFQNIPGVQQRVMGGRDVPLNKYPWFARLFKSNGFSNGCGAMLVAPQWILTAAHCMEDTTVDYAEIGKLCRQKHNCNQFKESFSIERVIMDPTYSKLTNFCDFALVKLSERSSIDPVIMDSGYSSQFLNGRANLIVLGFGDTNNYDNLFPPRLQEAEVKYMSNAVCRSMDNHGPIIEDEMICARDEGKGTCSGDSGGPLFDSELGIVIGVTSWMDSCGSPEFPGK